MTEFEWDDKKAEANYRKHGIHFEDAKFAFFNLLGESQHNRTVDGEERWRIDGISKTGLPIRVIYTIKKNGELIRIISARRLDKKERRKL